MRDLQAEIEDYAVGAMPIGNAGPSKEEECGTLDLKLVSGTMLRWP